MKLHPAVVFLCLGAANAQITIQVGGQTVGSQSTLNFTNGAGVSASGIIEVCRNSGNRIDCSASYNSAFIATHDTVHANENYCASSNGTAAYTCNLPYKALTAYNAGMTLVLNPDIDCNSSCSLSINGLARLNIKKSDGTTDPGGTLLAGQPQWIFYDGRVFRLMGGASAPAGPVDQRGDVIARRVIASMDTMPYAATISLDVTAGDLHKTLTASNVGNGSIDASTAGLPGQHMWIIVANDTVSPKTISFGRNFRISGPLIGTPGKSATLQFISDGTAWYEVARTLNL